MPKKKYAVGITMSANERRLASEGNPSLCLFIEQLRYAGILKVVKDVMDECKILYIYPPKGVDDKVWADMNSQRMRSFGINAYIVTL